MDILIAVAVGAVIVVALLLTVRLRRDYQEINEPPEDMRRAGEDTRPPFEGRGQGV